MIFEGVLIPSDYRAQQLGISSVRKFLLKRCCINLNDLIIALRNIEFQRISSTNVSHLFEH